jgi:putative transcriptional regulator
MAICVALGVALAGESVAGGSLDSISIAPALPGTSTGEPDRGMFLVATRALDDSHFGQSVVYLVEHGEDGTLGLIVNRSSDISLSEAVPDIEDKQATAYALYYGGPVGLPMILMLVRSESPTEGMEHVANGVYISSDRRVLDEVIAVKKPENELRFYIGHSGWAAGQLDFELERGSWHVVAADTDAIFSGNTDSLWDRLIERLEPRGIQVDNRRSLPILAFGTKHSLTVSKTILDIAGSYSYAGHLEEADKYAARVLEKNSDFTLSWWRERRLYDNPADSEHYFDGLRKAGLPE